MPEEFVSEEIQPVPGTFDASGMAAGEPGLPGRFLWQNREYAVADVLEKWKSTGRCRTGSEEYYVRRHWFRARVESGEIMTIYFERQPRSPRERLKRWWLYSVAPPDERKEAAP